MASKTYEEKYTKPELREKLKDQLKNSTKGGKKGKWSARKSQLLVTEYEKKGGDYKKDKNNEEAKSLRSWTDQEWQTKEGKGRARQQGKMKRYLPKKVWDLLDDRQKEEANRIKEKADQKGQHKVKWTPAIRKAFKQAGFDDDKNTKKKQDFYQKAKELDISGRSKMNENDLEQAVTNRLQQDLEQKNKKELYNIAKKLDVDGRSSLSKNELVNQIIKEELA